MSNTVSRAPRRNRQFWIDHVKRWRNTKETSEKFQEANVGNFIVRHDPDTGRIFVGHAKSKEGRFIWMMEGPQTLFKQL